MASKRSARGAHTPYSMPELSELYGRPPYEYRDTKQLLVTFRTDPKVLRKLVPAPLVADKSGNMFVAISEFFTSGFGHYHEINMSALATFKGRPVNYGLYLILDNDIATAGGREIWGFPKKMGRVALETRDGIMRGTVERGGIQLVEAAVQLKTFGSADDLAGSAEYVSRKLIPSVSNDAPPEVFQLTSTTLTNIEIREVHKGPATLRFGLSPADRFADIPIEEVTGGFYYHTDFTLEDGVVVHDYLA
ncbi:MAG: acetoacetate decarboxylase family protein [Gammaproteobacteria bacterium]|nr:acetoacetate decarboxylase family protein [Gammaproteobacteria bacterium]